MYFVEPEDDLEHNYELWNIDEEYPPAGFKHYGK